MGLGNIRDYDKVVWGVTACGVLRFGRNCYLHLVSHAATRRRYS